MRSSTSDSAGRDRLHGMLLSPSFPANAAGSGSGAPRASLLGVLVVVHLVLPSIVTGEPTTTPRTTVPAVRAVAADDESPEEKTAIQSETQERAGRPDEEDLQSEDTGSGNPAVKAGGATGSFLSWMTFERVLLLVIVLSNGFLLTGIGLWFWRLARRQRNLGMVLPQKLDDVGMRLKAIEEALRALPGKGPRQTIEPHIDSNPEPPRQDSRRQAPPSPISRPNWEPPRSPPPSVREPRPQPWRTGLPRASQVAPSSNASSLVAQYCRDREGSIVELGEQAKALGLEIGSPSSTGGQRHRLNAPDEDSRLLAIRDGGEERFFIVVGSDAQVTESEWLDLFQVQTFPGLRPVRSKRPAVVDARSGEVEQKGELEVLG